MNKAPCTQQGINRKSCTFTRQSRLLTPQDYNLVFSHTDFKAGNSYVLLLARKNPQYPARLGLVVAKKKIHKAVHRNRFKRLSREIFRYHTQPLQGLDVLVLARKNINELTSQQQYQQIQHGFKKLLEKIEQEQIHAQ